MSSQQITLVHITNIYLYLVKTLGIAQIAVNKVQFNLE